MAEALRRVAAGLTLVYYACALVPVAAVVALVGLLILVEANSGARPGVKWAGVGAYTLTVGIAALLSSAVGLAGLVRCAAVPDSFGTARTLALSSLVVDAAALAIGVLGLSAVAAGTIVPPELGRAAHLLNFTCEVVGTVLFLLFARAVATAVREPGLAERAAAILRLTLAAVGCHAVAAVFVGLAVAGSGWAAGATPRGRPPAPAVAGAVVGGVLALTASGIALVAFVKYMILLSRLSAAVSNYALGVAHRGRGQV